MKRPIQRIAAFVTLLFFALTSISVTFAQNNRVVFRLPSPSGSFLAGQEAFQTLGTRQAAQSFLDATESQWDNPDVIERAFAALAADGRIKDAESLARRMLELDPQNGLASLLIGTVALKERRYSSAIQQLESMGLENFIDIAAAVIQAWSYVGKSDLEQALRVLDEMGSDGLENFLVFHQALMADFSGDPRAFEFAQQAYEADPFVVRAVEVYSRVLGNGGKGDEALQVISSFENEGLSHASINVVRSAIEAGRLPGKYATSVSAGAAALYNSIGTALARDGVSDMAMVFLQLGHYLDPASDATSLAIARLFDRAGKYESANEIYDAIPKNSPFRSEAIVLAAGNLDEMGDRKGAISRLREILKLEPENLDAISTLGDILRSDEQFVSSIEAYTRALEIAGGDRPRDWRFYYVRGISYERSDNWELAEKDLLRALELNPNQPQVLNYLGYSWVDKGLNLDRALSLIETAVSSNPRDGYIVDSLGWAIYKLERYDEAVRILEQAVRLLPNDPEINDHLGDAYWFAGRKREARFQWTIASDVDEHGVVRERVIPKLENGLGDG